MNSLWFLFFLQMNLSYFSKTVNVFFFSSTEYLVLIIALTSMIQPWKSYVLLKDRYNELSCSETKITVAGITFALQHLPELKQIEHNVLEFDTFGFFQLDHEQGKKCCLTKLPMPTDTVHFTDLQVHGTPLTSGNIGLIGSVFLSLEHLEIHECGFASGVSDAEFIGIKQI